MKKRILTTLVLSIILCLGEASTGIIAAQEQRDATESKNTAVNKRGQTAMREGHDRFTRVADLVKSARIQSSGTVPEQSRQSLPVPVFRNGNLLIAFLYCPALALPKRPVKMSPPQHIVFLRADTGSLVELRAITSKDFGQNHRPGELIGTFGIPEKMTVEDFIIKLDRLYGLYDILLPEFALRKTKTDPRIKAAAREFNALFPLLSEPPLKPYYRSLGMEYFNWVDEIAL